MVVVLQENMNSVIIWNVGQNKQETMELDNAKAKASFVSWSKTHPVLAVGTDKVFIFYSREVCFFTIRGTKKKYLLWENTAKKSFQETGITMDY